MSAGTPGWHEAVFGPEPEESGTSRLVGRHRQGADRRRAVVASGALLGFGLAATVDSLIGFRLLLRLARPLAMDVTLQVLSVAVLVAGGATLTWLYGRRRLVPAWCIGGILIGAGIYGMVEGVLRHILLQASSRLAYVALEAAAVALLLLGAWVLRRPRSYSR